jgi:acyl-CoA hydrolase
VLDHGDVSANDAVSPTLAALAVAGVQVAADEDLIDLVGPVALFVRVLGDEEHPPARGRCSMTVTSSRYSGRKDGDQWNARRSAVFVTVAVMVGTPVRVVPIR